MLKYFPGGVDLWCRITGGDIALTMAITVVCWSESVLFLEKFDEMRGVREITFDTDLRNGFVGRNQ